MDLGITGTAANTKPPMGAPARVARPPQPRASAAAASKPVARAQPSAGRFGAGAR